MSTPRTATTKWKALRAKAIHRARREGQELCPRCGIILDYSGGPRNRASAEADHIVPYSSGGTDHVDNIQIVCGRCNRQMQDKGAPRPRTSAQGQPSAWLVTSREW